jgi:integrase/recombinase XerD
VPLSADLVAALTPLIRGPKDLVFADEHGQALSLGKIQRELAKIGRRAQTEVEITPHLLRHTFATHAAENGVPVHILQAWMGHSDIRITERYIAAARDDGASYIELLCPKPHLKVVRGGRTSG